MKGPRFADGKPVPDEEVLFDPDVDAHYGDASRGRMATLKARLQKHLAGAGKRPGRHPADKLTE